MKQTIKDLIKNFTDTAKSKKIPLFYDNESGVDTDIFAWLPDAVVTETPQPTGEWKKVDTENGTTEAKMLETALKMSLSQAVVKFTEMLKNGEFHKEETYRIIFLTETRNGSPLELVCGRRSGGSLNLCVHDVGSDDAWRGSDDAWFSSNEPLNTGTSETLTLEKAIELVKENGFIIYKQM